MSNKDNRKKDGQDRGKDRKAMREGKEFQERIAHEERYNPGPQEHDEGDIVPYRSGSPSDRTRTGAT